MSAPLGLAHVNLRAAPALLRALRDFYVEVIGLTEGPRPPFRSRGYWLYAGGQDVLHLTECDETETRQGQSAYDHFALQGSDLPETQRRLQRLGIAYERQQVPQTGVIQLFLRDPAGLGVELNFR